MSPKTEQTLVGLFVLIAGGILLVAVFAINGAFGSTAKTYHAHFQFAGGLEPGATVRYSGGPKVGRVESLRIDPQDPTPHRSHVQRSARCARENGQQSEDHEPEPARRQSPGALSGIGAGRRRARGIFASFR